MNPREFVDIRMRRCMAQTLEELEKQVEQPLRELHGSLSNGATARHIGRIVDDIDGVKRTFRKRLQAFGSDCADVMPSDVEINGFEPIRR